MIVLYDRLQCVEPFCCNFSISPGKSYFATIQWIPAFAGMTGGYTQSSFPRRRESSDCYPDLLRSYFLFHLPEFLLSNFKFQAVNGYNTFSIRNLLHQFWCKIDFGIFTKLMPIIQQGNSCHYMTEYYVTNLCNR